MHRKMANKITSKLCRHRRVKTRPHPSQLKQFKIIALVPVNRRIKICQNLQMFYRPHPPEMKLRLLTSLKFLQLSQNRKKLQTKRITRIHNYCKCLTQRDVPSWIIQFQRIKHITFSRRIKTCCHFSTSAKNWIVINHCCALRNLKEKSVWTILNSASQKEQPHHRSNLILHVLQSAMETISSTFLKLHRHTCLQRNQIPHTTLWSSTWMKL